MKASRAAAVALTVAGSDCGGGAGIQADLTTFHSFGVFGASVVTAITAQNPDRITAVQRTEPRIVREQFDRIFEAFPVGAAKTGMLYDTSIIETVVDAFRKRRFKSLVVDPVMVASSGALLLRKDAIHALRAILLPAALLVTPNVSEAEVLWQRRIESVEHLRVAARALADKFGAAFVVKGGHLAGAKRAVDVLFDGRQTHNLVGPLVPGVRTHGTGCAFSAAIAANLALGCGLVESVANAKGFVSAAIRSAKTIRGHCVLNL